MKPQKNRPPSLEAHIIILYTMRASMKNFSESNALGSFNIFQFILNRLSDNFLAFMFWQGSEKNF